MGGSGIRTKAFNSDAVMSKHTDKWQCLHSCKELWFIYVTVRRSVSRSSPSFVWTNLQKWAYLNSNIQRFINILYNFKFSTLILFSIQVWYIKNKTLHDIFILGWPCIIYKFVLFLFQLDKLIFSFFTFTIFLYMFRTGWSIIRRIKCLITQAASGTVPSVVDESCVAVGVRLSHSNTNGHARLINDRGNGARGCLCN